MLWIILALIVFAVGLGRNTQLSSHELRVTETAVAMARSGWPWNATPIDVPQVELRQAADGSHLQKREDGATLRVNPWLVPVFEGEIRLQKPPLPYWTTAIPFRVFGEGPGVARLVPALLGVLFCWLISRLALYVAGRRASTVALSLAIASYFTIDEFRKVMADPFLACSTLAAIVAWVAATLYDRGRAGRIVLFYTMLGVASLAKGPVAFLHVAVALAAFFYVFRRRPRVSWVWHLAGIAIYLAIALPWPIYIITHLPSAMEIWRFESIGEFSDNLRNARPFWYYLPNLLLIAAPWTAVWITSGADLWKRPSRRRAFAWIWLLAIVAIFSCSHMKKNAYLLPVVPAITIATATAIVRVFAIARRKRHEPTLAWAAAAHWIGGIAFAVMIGVASFKYLGGVTAIVVCAAAAVAALLPLKSLRRRDYERWFSLQAIAFALLIFLFLAFPEARHRSLKKPTADDNAAAALPAETLADDR